MNPFGVVVLSSMLYVLSFGQVKLRATLVCLQTGERVRISPFKIERLPASKGGDDVLVP